LGGRQEEHGCGANSTEKKIFKKYCEKDEKDEPGGREKFLLPLKKRKGGVGSGVGGKEGQGVGGGFLLETGKGLGGLSKEGKKKLGG